MTGSYWCEQALVGGAFERRVRLTIDVGRFRSIEIGVDAAPTDRRLAGATIPGLANAHSHAFHRALRSRTQRDGGTFWSWRDLMYGAADRLDPDNYRALARATFAEMALAGVTCVGEFHYVHHRPDGTPYAAPNAMGSALLAAAAEVGIRITLLDTLYLHGGLERDGYLEPSPSQRRFDDGSAVAWIDRVELLSETDGVRIGAAIHSVRAVDPPAIAAVCSWASERHRPLHAHVSEQTAENDQCRARHGGTPTGLLVDAGALDTNFTAVHATHLTDDDVGLLATASVCMCPTTERDLGDGIGPTTELVDAHATLTLGSDSHAVIDLFEEARAVELDERLRSMRRGAHQAADLLAAATVNGHRCLGWDDAGTIAVGARADLVTVALDSPRTAGAGHRSVAEAVVFAASAADVTNVIVDGRDVVVDGRHVGIDVTQELDRAVRDLMGD